jgi:hypothetical protein
MKIGFIGLGSMGSGVAWFGEDGAMGGLGSGAIHRAE